MLILKGGQRYFERFKERSAELYPLSEEEEGNGDSGGCQNPPGLGLI